MPWFVWSEHFGKGMKTITVSYTMRHGIVYHGNKHIGASNSRSFKYILHTGAGWHKHIGKADVEIRLHDIVPFRIEEVTPIGSIFDRDKKILRWHFDNLKPTEQDDISIMYYDPDDRRWVDDYFKTPASLEETYGYGKWYKDYVAGR